MSMESATTTGADGSFASSGSLTEGGDPRETGTAMLREGRFDEAATMLREAVTRDSSDEGAWRMLGAALAQGNRNEEAIEAFQQAANLSPLAAKSHYNLGLALQGAGRVDEARAALEKALALDPGYEQARQRLEELSGTPTTARTYPAPEPPMPNIAPPPPVTTLEGGSYGGGSSTLGTIGQAPPPMMPPPLEVPSSGLGTIGGASGTSGLSSVGSGSFGGNTYSAPPPLQTNSSGPVSPASLDTPSAYTPPPTLRPSGGSMGDYAPPPQLGMNYGDTANTSGMKGDVPPQVASGFNWGAFGLNWIWLLNMRQPALGLGFLGAAIVLRILALATGGALSPVVSLLVLGAQIYLGFIGNKLAWQNRRFESIEDFKACQRTWGWWVLGIYVGAFVLGFMFAGLIMAVFMAGAGGGRR